MEKQFKKVAPNVRHEAFRKDLIHVMDKHAGKLSAPELLALSAYVVGQIIAHQDQRKMTTQQAMDLVARNIQQGNQDIVADLIGKTAGSA